MKPVTDRRLLRRGFFLAGSVLAAVGCQSDGPAAPQMIRPAAIAVEAAASPQADEAEGKSDGKGPGKEEASLKDQLAEATEKRVLAEQARSYAETESELAKLDQQAGEIQIAESLRGKREALKIARDELASFETRRMPLAKRDADLSVDRSSDRLLKAETDLANMREIMSEEAEAKNKGEIIRRYETSFRFAQESLAIQTEERALLLEVDHPGKLAKLSNAVREAEAKLQAEEITANRKRQAADLDVRKAKHNFDKAKRKLKKASRKEKKLKAKAAAGGEEK